MADAEKVEKVCIGLNRHKDGICQAKDGSICPYWEIDARCSRVMMDDALSVIRELKAENDRLTISLEKMTATNDYLNKEVKRLKQENDNAITFIQDLKEEIKELTMTARG